MNANVSMFLNARASARAVGDIGLERAMNADLARIGYVDPAPAPVERVVTDAGMETAAVHLPERAVPKNRGGRPPLPRCQHNKIAARCTKCTARSK